MNDFEKTNKSSQKQEKKLLLEKKSTERLKIFA